MPWADGELDAYAAEISWRCAARARELGVDVMMKKHYSDGLTTRVVDDDLRTIVDRKFNQDVVQAVGRTVKGLVCTGESQNLPPFIIGLVTGTTSLASYEGRAALERPWDPETYTPRSMTRFENRLPPFSDAPSIGEFVAWRHFGFAFEDIGMQVWRNLDGHPYTDAVNTQRERSGPAAKPKAKKKPAARKPSAKKPAKKPAARKRR